MSNRWKARTEEGHSWIEVDVSADIGYEVSEDDDGRFIACVTGGNDYWLGKRYRTERAAVTACKKHASTLAAKLAKFAAT